MLEALGTVYTVVMIVLGFVLLYQRFIVGPKRPVSRQPSAVSRQGVRRAGVKRSGGRPRPTEQREVVSWPTAIAYFAAYAMSRIRKLRYDLARGWRAGSAVFVTSHSTVPVEKHADGTRETTAETETKPGETAETMVIAPIHAPEMLVLATLVRARAAKETAGLEALFGVKAGSSKEYQFRRQELAEAISYLEMLDTPPAAPLPDAELTDAEFVQRYAKVG